MSLPQSGRHRLDSFGVKCVCAGAIAVFALAGTPKLAQARVSGGCTAQATESGSDGKLLSTIDITSQSEWHVHKDSVLSGSGHAPTVQTEGEATADSFGFSAVTIASGKGKGQDGSGSIDLSTASKFVRVIGVEGHSDSCSGSLEIFIDNVNPVTTAAGGGGLALGVLGLAGVAGVGLRKVKG